MFCVRLKPGFSDTSTSDSRVVPCFDISKSRHTYAVGHRLRVERGPHRGWQGTVVGVHWDGSYALSKFILPSNYDINGWLDDNGSWWIDGHQLQNRMPGAYWLANGQTETVRVISEEVSLLDPAANFEVRLKKDFLVNKIVMVSGAHHFKGLKGFVRSVDLATREAVVSLDVTSMTSNKSETIPLEHLLLDVSNEL